MKNYKKINENIWLAKSTPNIDRLLVTFMTVRISQQQKITHLSTNHTIFPIVIIFASQFAYFFFEKNFGNSGGKTVT